MRDEATLEPLRVRPGARFTCHGDGLCCTDVHGIGPLSELEAEMLRALDEAVVVEHQSDLTVLQKQDGGCIFLEGGRCALHAQLGAAAKPRTCRHFPFVFVATPAGGRLSTEHRCPCRTLGERAPLEAAAASAAVDPRADRVLPARLPLSNERTISLSDWEPREASLLERLLAGAPPRQVLQVEPFELGGEEDWIELGVELAGAEGDSRFAGAARRFAGTLLRMRGAQVQDLDERLRWRAAFDRAEARSPEVREPAALIHDWVADWLWSLEWALLWTFEQTRVEIVSRVAVAEQIASDLAVAGARADRAAAEAVAVAEIVGTTDVYRDFVRTL